MENIAEIGKQYEREGWKNLDFTEMKTLISCPAVPTTGTSIEVRSELLADLVIELTSGLETAKWACIAYELAKTFENHFESSKAKLGSSNPYWSPAGGQ